MCERKGLPTEILTFTTLPVLREGLCLLCTNELHWKYEFPLQRVDRSHSDTLTFMKNLHSFPRAILHTNSSQCSRNKYEDYSLLSQEEFLTSCSSTKSNSRCSPNPCLQVKDIREMVSRVELSWDCGGFKLAFPELDSVVTARILIWDKRNSQFAQAGDITSFTEICTTLALNLHDPHRLKFGGDTSFLRRFTNSWNL